MDTSGTERVVCVECRNGKHANCVGWAFDKDDRKVDCQCEKYV